MQKQLSILLALAVLATFATASYAADSMVASDRVESIGLFKNGLAYVTREIEITNSGESVLADVPKPAHGSFWIESPAGVQVDVRVTEREQPASTSIARLAKMLDGATVTAHFRAEDLPAFLDAGMKATPEMRRVRFPLRSRLAVVPVELVLSAKYALFIAACFLLLAGLGRDGYSAARVKAAGLSSAALFLVGWLVGGALVPALLPWLPGRSFSAKGAWTGLAAVLAVGAYAWASPNIVVGDWLSVAAWFLMIPAVASFLGMNFTGASTYTSLSGVQREMRVAVPIQITAASVGVLLCPAFGGLQ